MLRPQSHHIFGIGAPLLFAVAVGIRNIVNWASKRNWKPQTVLSIIVLIAATGLGFGEASGIRRVLRSIEWQNRDCLNQLVQKIPANAPVYIDPKYGGLLAGRAILLSSPPNKRSWKNPVPGAWALFKEDATLPEKVNFMEKRCGAALLKL